MSKEEEQEKFEERGQEFTSELEALEDARDVFQADRGDVAAKEAFKQAMQAVVAGRVTDRQTRESQPAPAGSTEIRDATGKVFGWTTPAGDAVTAQGGRQG